MDLDDIERQDDAPATTSKNAEPSDGLERFERAVTINRSAQDLYGFWRNFENLPQIMDNIIAVQSLEGDRSRWTAKGPAGSEVSWTSKVTEDVSGAFIAWQSEDDADVYNEGRISFTNAQGDRGTVVTALMAYEPPAGFLGRITAKILQREPEVQLRRDLRRFKQLMETGEIATNVRNLAQLAKEGK